MLFSYPVPHLDETTLAPLVSTAIFTRGPHPAPPVFVLARGASLLLNIKSASAHPEAFDSMMVNLMHADDSSGQIPVGNLHSPLSSYASHSTTSGQGDSHDAVVKRQALTYPTYP